MTEHPESLREALDDHDVTLALTPAQLVMLLLALLLLGRLIKRLRG